MTDALLLRDLEFGYGRTAVVRSVSLRLSPGDCYGFLGHNGAGKTTVLRLVTGLLRPRRGDVRVFGIDAQRAPRRAHGQIGALIERPGFHLHSSARQNLVALARLQGIARTLAVAESDRVLEVVGLEGAAGRRVGTFSMGMRQRLGIARALLGQPPLLLLDEPGNGLDPEGMADLRALLSRLRRDEGCTVLLSSHQLAELEGICNRIGVLREGAMVAEGDLESLRRQLAVRHVVAGRPLAALEHELRQLGLEPAADGDRLIVDLKAQPPAVVARALATGAELTAFAPEPVTLEQIYLRAQGSALPIADFARERATADADRAPPRPPLGSTDRALRRAFGFELGTLLRQRACLPFLLLPLVVGAWSVHRYGQRIRESLALVEAGERFSADAGSGYLAVAQGLATATPVLVLALLWFASQSIAADVSGDTLRNTLLSSVRRRDVLAGKIAVLLSATGAAWAALVLTVVAYAGATFGFGNLEEVSGHGDRDLLASSAEVRPALMLALAQMLLPLAALVALGVAASALARRPARALAAALLLTLGPELARGTAGEHAGWLLTCHLPIGLRDDSALGWLAAVARGAADAVWPWAELAVLAPLAWLIGGCTVAMLSFRWLRVP